MQSSNIKRTEPIYRSRRIENKNESANLLVELSL